MPTMSDKETQMPALDRTQDIHDRRVTVRVPTDLHARAAAFADADDRSLSSVVRRALAAYLSDDAATAA